MRSYFSTRMISMIPVVLLVTFMVFIMTHLIPGDPVMQLIPPEEVNNLTPADFARIRNELGLDRPLLVQYVDWLGRVAQGDLGRSLRTREPVASIIVQRLPLTLQLALVGMVLSLSIALPLGVLAAVRRGSITDSFASVFGLLGLSTPNIFLGIVLIYFFTLKLRILPSSGWVPFTEDSLLSLKHMLMPGFVVGTALMGSVMRITRTSMLEVLRTEFITTARSKGLPERVVIYRHALKNALIPVTTVIGLQVAGLLGGSFIVEQIFALPGVGRIAVGAIFARDFPVVQGVVLFFALLYLFINLIVDLLYGLLDPRIRFD
jgi:peptide/nickel transport system permease protein